MFKTQFLKSDLSCFVFKLSRIFFLLDDWLLFEHEKQIFHVNSCLVNFSKESSHVEQWSSHLHEQRLYHHKITWRQSANVHSMRRHQQIDGQSRAKNNTLSDIKTRQRLLNNIGLFLEINQNGIVSVNF